MNTYTDGLRTMKRDEWVNCVAAVYRISHEDAETEVQERIDSGMLKGVM